MLRNWRKAEVTNVPESSAATEWMERLKSLNTLLAKKYVLQEDTTLDYHKCNV